MELYGWKEWPGFFPVKFLAIGEEDLALVLDCGDFRILSSNVRHFVPTIGLRLESLQTGKVIAYSCDTEPCEAVIRLAKNADILFHEANSSSDELSQKIVGHSSTIQAGDIARQANVKSLALIHYPTNVPAEDMIAQAKLVYGGKVELAHDFTIYEL